MARKKSIDESNPALQFITGGSRSAADVHQQPEIPVRPADVPVRPADVPEGYKLNPMFIEVKSKRVQLIMQPSLFEKAKKTAGRKGLSFNEYIHRVLKYALDNDIDV